MDPNFSQSYQGASFRLLHKHQLRNFSMRDSLRFSSWIWRKIMPNARRLRATTVWLVLSIHSVSINCTMLQRSCSRCMNHGCLAEHNPLTPSSCVESWDNLARISSWLPIQWLTKPGVWYLRNAYTLPASWRTVFSKDNALSNWFNYARRHLEGRQFVFPTSFVNSGLSEHKSILKAVW